MNGLEFLIPRHTGRQHIEASSWAPASTADTTASGTAFAGSVHQLHRSRRSDGTDFEVLNVFLRGRDDDEVLLYAFDTLGYPPDPPARGRWLGPDLVLDRTTARGSSRTTFTPAERGYRWSKQFRRTDDEPWQTVFTEELHRT